MNGFQENQPSMFAQDAIAPIGTGRGKRRVYKRAERMLLKEKRCAKCEILKELSAFRKLPKWELRIDPYCEDCRRKLSKERSQADPEKNRARARKWQREHPEKAKRRGEKWRTENKDRYEARTKRWRDANPDKIKKAARKSYMKICSTPGGRLGKNISRAMNHSLHGGKGKHWELLVRYTSHQLKKHLGRQFSPEMSWENYGSYWQIDHIIPINAFNFETPNDIDFKKCWALRNLQPLERKKNILKRDKVERPFQPALL